MPRVARIVVPDVPHHITQRGNNRQDVFFTDDDRRLYLGLLREQAETYGLEVLGWCLMTNHVHLIARPRTEEALAKALGRTHFLYTQTVNRWHGRSGHLWQNRFFSCPLGREHFWQALRYVEQNPVRAKLARRAWAYEWSSAAAHVGGEDKTGLLNLGEWKRNSSRIDWRVQLTRKLPAELMEQVRLNTHTGRPLAGDAFISKLENRLNKRLRPLPIGETEEE